MAAFGAQVVPGSTDWLVRPNTRCGEGSARILSDNNQTMDVVADSPPSQSYQLDYKCKMTPFVCVKPDPDDEFITDRHRVMTSQFDYNSIVASGGRARLLGDEFRQRQGDWPITSGFHDSDANAGLRLQEEIIAKYRRRLLPEDLVDASVVDHRLQAPSWNNVTSSPPEVAATSRVAKYSISEREAVYDLLQQQSDVYNRYHRDGRRGDQTLPPPLDAVKEDNEPIEDDASYHPRRLMFAVDKEQKQTRSQNRGVETRYPPVGMERRHSPPELSRRSVCSDQLTPPGSDADLSSTDYSYERRQTWPLDSPFLPSWRRKVHHDDGLQSEVGGDSASVESDCKKQLQQQQQHPVPAAAGGAVGQDGRSPISELMQMYDVAMTSHLMKRHSVQTGKSSVCSDDPMTSSPRQSTSVNSALDDTSKLSPSPGSKQFSCHICPYIGDKKNDFDAHMRIHFDHWCPYCNYSSRTEGRLRCHIKMFHSSRDPLANGDLSNKKRPKSKIACRHCDFSTKVKEELWLHMRQHIPPEKMLECPRCTFVTDLKHHLEYHLRSSHIGSKPYKCDKCTYRCFNQSMLNSHAKSHTNVYQFRCRDCPFAAKYCHALKVHIRRYGHEAAPVLNEDGSQPADGSGDFALISRRGRPRGLRGGAQGDMPRFRSVRSRSSAQNGGGPNAKPPVLPAVEFLDTKLGPSMAMPGNLGFQDIEKMFFGQRSTTDQVLDQSEGALPSFAKLAGKAGLPQLYTPELALAVSGLTSYPERRDVTLASCSPPNHQQRAPLVFSSIRSQLNDVVMAEPSGCFMKTHPRPPGAFDHDDRMFSSAGQSTALHQNLSPQPYSYNDEGDVPSPPIPEPERGQCGDLPLDLTLPSGRQREEDFTELERIRESEKMSRDRKRSPSPDDDEFDEQVFRRRRHFREWFKLQSLRHDEPVRSGRLDDDPDAVMSRRRERTDDCVADVESVTSAAKIEPLTSHSNASPYPDVAVNEDANEFNAASMNQSGCNVADRMASPTVGSPSGGTNRSRSSSQGSSDETSALAGSGSEASGWVATGRYQCVHCEIDFHGSRALHAMHMSYHSNADPFRCNVCGEMTEDRVAFFEHLARVAHN